MGLYTDSYCLKEDESLGMTLDDFGRVTDINLGSKDATDDDSYNWAYEWWYDTQEYTLTQLNEVYEDYTYCTSCVDYPTYQDGYFIGDYGTDDDDLINQCWKFHSHDSFTCEADCIALGHAQQSILSIDYGGRTFGSTPKSYYQHEKYGSSSSSSENSSSTSGGSSSSSSSGSSSSESSLSRLLANLFLAFSFLSFVATFLAFVVARRSRYRQSRSAKSRRLLDDDQTKGSRRSRRSSRSKKLPSEDGDGIFRKSSRSKSRSKKSRSASGDRDRKRSSSKRSKYDPPSESRPRSKEKRRSGD